MSCITYLSESNFESSILGKKAVLVVFYEDWCGHCRQFAPVLEQLAGEVAGDILVAEVNVDQNMALAAKFGVKSVPYCFILKDGNVVEEFGGTKDKAELKQKLKSV